MTALRQTLITLAVAFTAAVAPASLVAQEEVPTADTAAITTIGPRGLQVTSADGRYGVRVHGFGQVAGRFYIDDTDELSDDSFIARRGRPNWTLWAPADVSFRLQLEVAGSISLLDAYVTWAPFPFLRLRVGRHKVPFGLELLQSPTAMDFLERSLASTFAPNRDNGAVVYGNVGDGLLTYDLGIFNGGPDGGNSPTADLTDRKEVMGRLFFMPFAASDSTALSGLGLGFAATWSDDSVFGEGLGGLSGLGSLSSYRTAGRRVFFRYSNAGSDGARLRLTGQLSYFVGGFYFMGEYVRNAQDVTNADGDSAELAHAAWHAGASYAFGGNAGPDGGVKPHRNFDLETGALGALELKVRASQARFDSDAFPLFADPTTSAETATEIAGGVNWWWSRNVRWMVDVYATQFGAAEGGVELQDELALIITLQLGL